MTFKSFLLQNFCGGLLFAGLGWSFVLSGAWFVLCLVATVGGAAGVWYSLKDLRA